MSYTDNDNQHNILLVQDTSATSDTPLIHPEYAGTDWKHVENWFLMDLPKSSKKTKSKWLNKKLKKMGR